MQSRRSDTIKEIVSTWGLTKRLVHSSFQQHFKDNKDAAKLAPAQLQLLFILKHCKQASLKELAQRSYLTPGAITQMVEALVQVGYVSRTPDKTDRRVTHVSLTTAGEKIFKDFEKKREKVFTELVESLTDEELSILLKAHKKLLDAVETKERTTNE